MCVVEVEPNVNKIIETFQNLDDKLYEKKIESINNFLEKDNLVKIKFSSEHNWKKLINMIDLYLTNQSYLDIQSS
jgi:hypothetical protein